MKTKLNIVNTDRSNTYMNIITNTKTKYSICMEDLFVCCFPFSSFVSSVWLIE